jgi:hypothetical protein
MYTEKEVQGSITRSYKNGYLFYKSITLRVRYA